MKLSIIIPCKNEEGNIIELHSKICDTLKKIKYEIIFIDDGSTDKTLDKLNEIYKKDKEHVRIISFSRNFKKESAMYAGCEHATGEYTCIMDGDMQQNPRYLLEMIDFLDNNEDYDEIAMMVKERTNESKIMRFCKKIFYKFIDSISDVHFESNASDFRMFRENVRKSIVAKRDIKSGNIINEIDIDFKRPANGISPEKIDEIIGKKVNYDIPKGSLIEYDMLS